MLCKNTICGAKVRPFYEVAKDFTEKLTQHGSTCLLARGYHPIKTGYSVKKNGFCNQDGTSSSIQQRHMQTKEAAPMGAAS